MDIVDTGYASGVLHEHMVVRCIITENANSPGVLSRFHTCQRHTYITSMNYSVIDIFA